MQSFKLPLLLIGSISLCLCQTTAPAAGSKPAGVDDLAKRLPPYIVYQHFLSWVDRLDNAASTSNAAAPYRFAEPFSRAGLQHSELDTLRHEAHKLAADLQKKDAAANVTIAKYRASAKAAAAQGAALPPPPPELLHLERERTAIVVQHYVALRSALGSDATARLDGYLNYEFAPHMKMKRVATPGQPLSTE